MKRKRGLVCLTAAVVVVCLSACSGSSGGPASTTGGGSAGGSRGTGGTGASGASGGSGGSCPTPPKTGDIPDDVAAVMSQRCWGCHGDPPKSHAPFPLVTYEDLIKPNPLQPGHLIVQTMAKVILPDATRPSGLPHMPLSPAPQLTSAQFATMSHWLDTCAAPVPEGTGGDLDGG
jgi:mono/diheme cytochrome c family protein